MDGESEDVMHSNNTITASAAPVYLKQSIPMMVVYTLAYSAVFCLGFIQTCFSSQSLRLLIISTSKVAAETIERKADSSYSRFLGFNAYAYPYVCRSITIKGRSFPSHLTHRTGLIRWP